MDISAFAPVLEFVAEHAAGYASQKKGRKHLRRELREKIAEAIGAATQSMSTVSVQHTPVVNKAVEIVATATQSVEAASLQQAPLVHKAVAAAIQSGSGTEWSRIWNNQMGQVLGAMIVHFFLKEGVKALPKIVDFVGKKFPGDREERQGLEEQIARFKVIHAVQRKIHDSMQQQLTQAFTDVVKPLESAAEENLAHVQEVYNLFVQRDDSLASLRQKAAKLALVQKELKALSKRMKEVTHQEKIEQNTAELLKMVNLLVETQKKKASLENKLVALKQEDKELQVFVKQAHENLKRALDKLKHVKQEVGV